MVYEIVVYCNSAVQQNYSTLQFRKLYVFNIFTARCYAELGIVTPSRPSVCPFVALRYCDTQVGIVRK